MDCPPKSIGMNRRSRRREELGGSPFSGRYRDEDRPDHKRDTHHSVLRDRPGRKSTRYGFERNSPLESPDYAHASVVYDRLSKREITRNGAYG